MRIVTYKTAYYSFYMPVACGMILAGIKDEAAFKVAEKILLEMGQYFQVGRYFQVGQYFPGWAVLREGQYVQVGRYFQVGARHPGSGQSPH